VPHSIAVLIALALAGVPSAATAAKPAYPATEPKPVVDTYRDVHVTDAYRWLEDWNDPAVKAWSEAQNALARSWLDAGKSREAIRARVEHLLGDTSPSWFAFSSQHGVNFALERRPPKQQPYLVVVGSLDDSHSTRVLVDPTALDPTGATSIGWYEPSPDGKKVAVALAHAGAESGNIRVFDVATGTASSDDVPQADGAGSGRCLAWTADGKGFFYTRGRPDGAAPNAFRHIQFHRLGDPVEKDASVLGQNGPRIAQWEVVTGDDGRTVVARMEEGDSNLWQHWVLSPGASTWIPLATFADQVKDVRVGADGSLYLLSALGAPRHKLLRTSGASPSLAAAEVVLPEGEAVIDDVLARGSRLYLLEDAGGVSRLRTAPLTHGKLGTLTTVPLPPVAAVMALGPLAAEDAAFQLNTYTQPIALYRVQGQDGAVKKTALAATSLADFSGVTVVRETCTSRDGTHVPVTVLRQGSAAPTGEAPTLLSGYGGFGVSVLPRFRPVLLAWLEQGGVYAAANIRGGGEMGETWHTDGNLTHKQNDFDDLYACAQHLVQAHYTSPSRLAIQGGSNGGLLMGAELTQHPEAFKAVVSQVGIYDMLRLERDANGAFNVSEYGSVNNPEQFAALYAYSPYHHVKDGSAYPATLFLTGANDPRVAPYHSRKMVARLQAATTSAAPILLRTSANTGHGAGTPLAAQIEEVTDVNVFLFQNLGVNYAPK
jgi:prolyl oligopeptidase